MPVVQTIWMGYLPDFVAFEEEAVSQPATVRISNPRAIPKQHFREIFIEAIVLADKNTFLINQNLV